MFKGYSHGMKKVLFRLQMHIDWDEMTVVKSRLEFETVNKWQQVLCTKMVSVTLRGEFFLKFYVQ